MTSPNEITFFTVVGHWFDIEAPDPAGASNTPQMLSIYGFVTFTPRLPPGTTILVPNLDLQTTLPPPANFAATRKTSGGTFTAGPQFWVITATDSNGEGPASNEVNLTFTGSNNSAILTWSQVDEATGYKIYRGTTGNNENTLVTTITDDTILTYTDTGAAGTAATPPPTTTSTKISANTALSLAPIQARILAGELQTIDRANTPDVQLLANTPILGLTKLIYDVSFTKVTYAGANQKLLNFAFAAPSTATTVDLCDPVTDLLPYDPTNFT